MISLKKLSRITSGRGKNRPTLVFELVKPMREWAYCLLLATVATLGLIAYVGLDFYSQFHTVDISAGDLHHKRSPYSVELGKNVLSAYESRSERFNLLLAESVPTLEAVLPPEGSVPDDGGGVSTEEENGPALESVQ
jgi:hypothetical protein